MKRFLLVSIAIAIAFPVMAKKKKAEKADKVVTPTPIIAKQDTATGRVSIEIPAENILGLRLEKDIYEPDIQSFVLINKSYGVAEESVRTEIRQFPKVIRFEKGIIPGRNDTLVFQILAREKNGTETEFKADSALWKLRPSGVIKDKCFCFPFKFPRPRAKIFRNADGYPYIKLEGIVTSKEVIFQPKPGDAIVCQLYSNGVRKFEREFVWNSKELKIGPLVWGLHDTLEVSMRFKRNDKKANIDLDFIIFDPKVKTDTLNGKKKITVLKIHKDAIPKVEPEKKKIVQEKIEMKAPKIEIVKETKEKKPEMDPLDEIIERYGKE